MISARKASDMILAQKLWAATSRLQGAQITSMDKMAGSSRFATVSEDDFRVEMFFFFSFLK